jgi:uncharacterized hydrophobic protein (TIGR00271 family)
MRQLQIVARDSNASGIARLAERHRAFPPASMSVRRGEEEGWRLFVVDLPNEHVGSFVEAVARDVDEAQFILFPTGTLPLRTPLREVAPRVRDVSHLSTLELVLASLQSVGSWQGMLLYSVLAGIVAAYGIVFDVVYLLVAAMLINPMGAPAMVAVIGVSVGDVRLFGRGGVRFFTSLAIQAAAAATFGIAYGLDVSTGMMEQVTSLSGWAALLALAAGAAGALSQVRSERGSLVSGTAAGFMIAAALAPPAAVLGLALPLGRGDYAVLMLFLLALQFLAIAVGGWLVLLLHGVHPRDPSTGRGAARWRLVLAVAVTLATLGAVLWQNGQEPRFLKAELTRTALQISREAVESVPGVRLVETSARFTRRQLDGLPGEAMLLQVHVSVPDEGREVRAIQDEVRREITERVVASMRGVSPFVDVTVLPGDGNR